MNLETPLSEKCIINMNLIDDESMNISSENDDSNNANTSSISKSNSEGSDLVSVNLNNVSADQINIQIADPPVDNTVEVKYSRVGRFCIEAFIAVILICVLPIFIIVLLVYFLRYYNK